MAIVATELVVSPGPRYQVSLWDPPWYYYGDPNKMGAAGKHYPLIPDQDMLALPVGSWIADPGVAFIWATGPRIDFAIDCIRSWGLWYRGLAFVWIKTTKDGRIIRGQGTRPSIVKSLDEVVLAASTERKGRPLPLASERVDQNILAPRARHSAKPIEIYQRIEELYPTLPKLEVFARTERPGWDAIGNQLVPS